MANFIDPQHYENMINALRSFASKTGETTQELYAACASCAQILGDGDVLANKLTGKANAIAMKYSDLAVYAQNIATAMEEDLEAYYKALANDGESGVDDGF